MEELDIKTAIQIAKILAAAPDERIPMILDVFSKAQVDINGLDELAEWRALDKQAALIDTDTFVTELTKGKELEDGEYRIRVPEFNHFCSTKGVSARYARSTCTKAECFEAALTMAKSTTPARCRQQIPKKQNDAYASHLKTEYRRNTLASIDQDKNR